MFGIPKCMGFANLHLGKHDLHFYSIAGWYEDNDNYVRHF